MVDWWHFRHFYRSAVQYFGGRRRGDIGDAAGQRAQVVQDPNAGFQQSWLLWFNKAAFQTPAQFTYGNSGRNNMRGPLQTNLDFVAYKDLPVTERKKLQFRAESFNIFNHTRFGVPNANVQNSAFGQILSAGVPRQIQFAIKFSY